MDNSAVGLTESQCQELRSLYRQLSRAPLPPLESNDLQETRRVHLQRFLYIYLEALCYDAAVENTQQRKRGTVKLRRDTLNAMNKLLGRELSLQDILKTLSSFAPLPDFAAAAIRRDYLRITV